MKIILLIGMIGLAGCGGEEYPLELPKPAVIAEKLEPKTPDDFIRVLTTENDLVFADRCGNAGTFTRGWLAMEGLVKLRRLNALEQVLRSKSTVGQLYAVLGIKELVSRQGMTVSGETKSLMQEVMRLNVKVTTCVGCIVSTKSAAEAYAEFLSLHPVMGKNAGKSDKK